MQVVGHTNWGADHIVLLWRNAILASHFYVYF